MRKDKKLLSFPPLASALVFVSAPLFYTRAAATGTIHTSSLVMRTMQICGFFIIPTPPTAIHTPISHTSKHCEKTLFRAVL